MLPVIHASDKPVKPVFSRSSRHYLFYQARKIIIDNLIGYLEDRLAGHELAKPSEDLYKLANQLKEHNGIKYGKISDLDTLELIEQFGEQFLAEMGPARYSIKIGSKHISFRESSMISPVKAMLSLISNYDNKEIMNILRSISQKYKVNKIGIYAQSTIDQLNIITNCVHDKLQKEFKSKLTKAMNAYKEELKADSDSDATLSDEETIISVRSASPTSSVTSINSADEEGVILHPTVIEKEFDIVTKQSNRRLSTGSEPHTVNLYKNPLIIKKAIDSTEICALEIQSV